MILCWAPVKEKDASERPENTVYKYIILYNTAWYGKCLNRDLQSSCCRGKYQQGVQKHIKHKWRRQLAGCCWQLSAAPVSWIKSKSQKTNSWFSLVPGRHECFSTCGSPDRCGQPVFSGNGKKTPPRRLQILRSCLHLFGDIFCQNFYIEAAQQEPIQELFTTLTRSAAVVVSGHFLNI